MRVGTVRKPGESGTEKLVAKYGDRLVAVRYRYSHAERKRFKTVELIVAEDDWTPPPSRDEIVSNTPPAAHGIRIRNCGTPPKIPRAGPGFRTGLCADSFYTYYSWYAQVLHLVFCTTGSTPYYAV